MARTRTALVATLLGGAIATVAGRSFRRLAIAEHSMEPALIHGDFVIAQRLRTPARGNIVTTRHPHRPDMLLVKRVVGLPHETVTIRNGQVHINERVLPERWADGPTHPDSEWVVGPEEVFLLSDNRAATIADSRTFGPVPMSSLGHKVKLRYWPASSAGKIT